MLLTNRLQLLDFSQIRLQLQLAFIGIEQYPLAVGQGQYLTGYTAKGWQAEGPGEDGHVAGSPTGDRDEAQHFAGIQAGGL